MKLVEVTDKQTEEDFLALPVRLYKKDKNWIRPLNQDIQAVFDPKRNKHFRHGRAIRWVLKDAQGKVIGRVAAFVNDKTANTYDQPTGGIGFFDCIDDQEAANILFDAGKNWLEEQGMEAMDGPINFGDRNNWWGLLVDGFTEPNYQVNYNYPYYQQLFENYGFQTYYKQYTYQRPMGSEVDLEPRFYKKAEDTLTDKDYEFRHLTKKDVHLFPDYFRQVYNQAWAGHSGVKEMSEVQAMNAYRRMKPILDVKLLWFAFYKGEPVAFFISIPEINQIFKKINGNLNLVGKLKFLYFKWTKSCEKSLGIVFGVVPQHQKKGVEGALVITYTKMAWKKNFQYKDLEMNWIGDFNPKMMRVAEQIGGKIFKTHITYRKLFDETKAFERASILH